MENKRPTGHGKKVGSGSAHVEKGEKVSSRPVGTGSGRTGSFDQRPGENRDGERSTAGKLGLLALLLVLPKKYRRILLIVIAVVAVLGMLGKCGGAFSGSDVSYYPETNQLSQATDAPYYTYAPVVTEAPVYTEAPVITPVPVVTEAPVVTAAPVVGEARAKRVVPKGNGKDTVTVMIYMCGTDLESKYGMGTSDLGEMVKATIDHKVNVIVETGGCRAWKNNIVSSSVNQIYQVQTGGLRRLESDFGKSYMTDPDNLASFIQYCKKNFPADRNILIFWDHGGGSLSGYGYDEKQGSGFGVSADTMTLPEIKAALQKGGCVFDWIGFDACLMATLETAMVCNDYADYMIASEESEPGTGWYYTDWLTQLSKNTSVSTESIGKTIVDTFVTASQRAQANAQVTLSVVDLAKMSGTVPQALRNFSAATTNLIKGNNYKQIADARANARQFARQSRINQVDMIDLCERIGTAESKTLAAALKGCVAYNKSTMTRAYGVSVYFPYETLNGVKNAINTYNNLGIDSEYTKCIQSFASVGQGGQFASSASQQGYGSYSSGGDLLSTLLGGFMDSGSYGSSGSSPYGSSSPLGSLLGDYTTSAGSGSYSAGNSVDASTIYDLLNAFSGRSMPAALDWVDTDLVASKALDISENRLDPARITIIDRNGHRALYLTDEEWDLIETATLNIFVDDSKGGYIDMGYDNVLFTDETDDNYLLLDYDGLWMCVDGHPAAFYMTETYVTEDGTVETYGRIPAKITGKRDRNADKDGVLKVDGALSGEKVSGSETVEMMVNLLVHIVDDDVEILGAYPLYDGTVDTEAKGLIPILKCDKIQLLCDYYTSEGAYEGSYTLGKAFTAGNSLTVDYREIDNKDISVSCRLTDIYGNVYWTPAYIY